mmetsp:Transcript_107929/g.336629  ORF Transcript_107929/g.336629 Transcript_107929/m.336629 type:complete len:668 (+) Transcript_107929:99-2102(+)
MLARALGLLVVVAASSRALAASPSPPGTAQAARSFVVANDSFILDGRKVQIRSGSVHYFRIPRAYWRDRLMRARAMGLNAVQTVIPWNWHEETQGHLRWDGNCDLEAYLRIAQELGLLVLLRPGPYICAEWEFGGFPAWLLPRVNKLRTYDESFIGLVRTWWGELLPRVEPLLYSHGGPVVMVQLENEYGSFGDVSQSAADRRYMEYLLALAREHLGKEVVIYTTDGGNADFMTRGSLRGGSVLTLGDGGWNCSAQAEFNPPGLNPCMNTECYAGWLTHWGEAAANSSAGDFGVAAALAKGHSFSIYMAHGGTNFGWMSGANGGGRDFQPDITSYDYGAPIAEDGSHGFGADGRDKYAALRDSLRPWAPSGGFHPEPAPLPRAAYGALRLGGRAPLLSRSTLDILAPDGPKTLPGGVLGSMEAALGQSFGFVLYEAELAAEGSVLEIQDYPRDRAQVFLAGEYQGAIYRPEAAPLKLRRRGAKGEALSLLVENMGRLNFGGQMYDPKGIPGDSNVTLSGARAAANWSAWPLPLNYDQVGVLDFSPVDDCSDLVGPTFFLAPLELQGTPVDTFLRLDGFVKGVVWINGVNIGRYWQARPPQRALYVPGPFLKKGTNELILLELERAPANCTVTFDDKQDLSGKPPTSGSPRTGAAPGGFKSDLGVAYI